jgi:YhcH/YjgK/YiaL family protein
MVGQSTPGRGLDQQKCRARGGDARAPFCYALETMIIDTLENASSYFSISPRIAAALKFLSRSDLAQLPVGKHSIDGDNIYALVQEYSTRPREKCGWEAHRRFIDIQFVQSGLETMGWSPIQQMTVRDEYKSDNDAAMFNGSGQLVTVPAGSFAIFMPQDVHMPCVAVDGKPQPVRKIVVKVAVG